MVKPIRRIVTGDDEQGKAVAFSDGPSPDVRLDPARPGFAATRLWVTDETPARLKGVRETLHMPHKIEPPANGSFCRVIEFPPESPYIGRIGSAEVKAYFDMMGSPQASVGGPHPYMQRTKTLDICYVLEGEITLVLDLEEVRLQEGDSVVIRDAAHAWKNHSDKPCLVMFSLHDGTR